MSDLHLAAPGTATNAEKPAAAAARPETSRPSKLAANQVALGAAVVFVGGFFVPRLLDDPFRLGIAIDGLLLGMVALAVGFLAHRSGLVSLGHAAYFGGAAYVVAIGTNKWGWHPAAVVVVAVGATTLFALLAGALIVRVSGISFAVLTLAIGQALYVLSVQTTMRPWTGGFDGMSVRYDRTILGWGPREFGNPEKFWPVAWIALSVACVVIWLVTRSRWGLVLEAIRENEERARFCGFSTYVPRLAAFVLSASIASLAGVLFALHTAFIAPDSLHWSSSGDALVAAIVGGVGLVAGPPAGALLYVFARDRFAASGDLQLYTGAALVIVLVLAPSGIASLLGSIARRGVATLRRWGR